jgi:transposase InsO family protein
LRELAAVRRRFGYRRLFMLMRREGLAMNHKKFRRIYREARLQVRSRGGRKPALGTRAPLTLLQGRISAGASFDLNGAGPVVMTVDQIGSQAPPEPEVIHRNQEA